MISTIKLGLANRKKAPLSSRDARSGKEENISRIGVVFDLDGLKGADHFLKLKKDLQINNGDFRTITCMAAKPTERPEGLVFSPAGLSWTGKIKDPEVQEFIDSPFDVLISFCRKETKASRIIMNDCKAELKVGRVESGSGYDLAISTPIEEVGLFIGELKKYLKILKKIPQ